MQYAIRDEMPLLARSEGVWEGVYRYVDESGKLIDEHRSRLTIRLFDSGPHAYHQTNQYYWADGRSEQFEFRCAYENGSRAIVYDNERIRGFVRELAEDPHRRSRFLYWERPSLPGVYFYELINVTDDGLHRSRVWQWIRANAGIDRRTLIDEHKVSDDWRNFDISKPL